MPNPSKKTASRRVIEAYAERLDSPTPASPWLGVKNVPMATGVSEAIRGAPAPVAEADMTLTGDMASSSPAQKAAASQFEANMQAAAQARGDLSAYDEKMRQRNLWLRMMEEEKRKAEGRLY